MMYPINEFKKEILSLVNTNPIIIVEGEPGCGKTTQVVQWLKQEGVLITQPGRIHAKENSRRVAEELRVRHGEEVGYHIARENRSSDFTEALFTTDGMPIVTHHIKSGRFKYLIIDEVHEWSENIEILVYWAKLYITGNPDARVILMSGTVDSERLSKYFNSAPVIKIPGRLFPIQVLEKSNSTEEDILKMHKFGCNILVFQPGKAEIEDIISNLKSMKNINAEILPLYGELEVVEQRKVFSPFNGLRIIVSTNICESSITIPYINCVIDSGLEKVMIYENGVQSMRLIPIALDSRTQRMNRAGRCSKGWYIDRCPLTIEKRQEYSTPEIQRVDLSKAYLQLKVRGINLEEIELFHQPDPMKISGAISLLKSLGCLDKSGIVTNKGLEVNELPVAPYIGCMILEAKKLNCLPQIIKIAAILSQEGFVHSKNSNWKNLSYFSKDSDLIAQMQLYDHLINNPMPFWKMKEFGIMVSSFKRVKDSIHDLSEKLGIKCNETTGGSHEDILKCIMSGMMDKIFFYTGHDLVNTSTTERRRFSFSSNCQSLRGMFYVGNPLDLPRKFGNHDISLVTLLSRIRIDWLKEICPEEFSIKTDLHRYGGLSNYPKYKEFYFRRICYDMSRISDLVKNEKS